MKKSTITSYHACPILKLESDQHYTYKYGVIQVYRFKVYILLKINAVMKKKKIFSKCVT